MKRKIELAYSRALVPRKGKVLKKVVICISIIAIIVLIVLVK